LTQIAPVAGERRLPCRVHELLGAAEVGVLFGARSSQVREERDTYKDDDHK
jgi:hypothetical protein